MSLQRDLEKVIRRSRQEQALLLESAFWLLAGRIAVPWFEFRRIAGVLRLVETSVADTALTQEGPTPQQVAWAVEAVAGNAPWTSTCLMRALAGNVLLRRRGISSVLTLGVATTGASGTIVAHAWLRCGESVLIGGRGMHHFAPLASFIASAETWNGSLRRSHALRCQQ